MRSEPLLRGEFGQFSRKFQSHVLLLQFPVSPTYPVYPGPRIQSQRKTRLVRGVILCCSEIRRPSTQNIIPRASSARRSEGRISLGTLALVKRSCNLTWWAIPIGHILSPGRQCRRRRTSPTASASKYSIEALLDARACLRVAIRQENLPPANSTSPESFTVNFRVLRFGRAAAWAPEHRSVPSVSRSTILPP